MGKLLRLDRRAPARGRGAVAGRDPERPAPPLPRGRRDLPAAARARASSTSRAVVASPSARSRSARAWSTSPPTSPSSCSTGPRRSPTSSASATRSPGSWPTSVTCRSRTGRSTWSSTFTGLHCFPDPARAVVEMVRVPEPGGVITGSAMLNDTGLRYEAMRRGGRLAGLLGPMCSSTEVLAVARRPGRRRRHPRGLRPDRLLPRAPNANSTPVKMGGVTDKNT